MKLDKIDHNYVEVPFGKTISLKENKRNFIVKIDSGKEIRKIHIDDPQSKNRLQGKRCDYLLLFGVLEGQSDQEDDESKLENLKIEVACYVELKGNKVQHAIEQIASTIQQLEEPQDRQKITRHCYVVCSPGLKKTAKFNSSVASFKQKYKTKLTIKTNKCEVKLSQLI